MTAPHKNWQLRERPTPDFNIEQVGERLGVSALLVQLLLGRGLATVEEMDVFLSPNLRHLNPLESIPGAIDAARVIAEALKAGKKMAVWGDYDVDGVTSTALVKDFMRRKGLECRHHIPNRMEEGYGLNTRNIERLAEDGIELLVTVDCGITSVPEIERAKELGMTVVITDHHLPAENLPPADAICNPQLDAACPSPHLAGVGVIFYVMCALNNILPGEKIRMSVLLDLVALGTIADVVKLSGDNRIMVKNGLLLIKEARRPGIFALKEVSNYSPTAEIGAGKVAFGLAPRINAAGRMGHAEKALRLLLCPDKDEARALAAELDTMNQERKDEEDRITDLAMAQAESQSSKRGLVLFDPSWHSGVIGIVASRVVERFYKPTLILTEENGIAKGSGRSIREFHLHEGLSNVSHLLEGYGGHKLAAGLRLLPEKLGELAVAFHEEVIRQAGDRQLHPTLTVDAEISLADVDYVLIKELELMQPFGMGNPEPVFASPELKLTHRKVFGQAHVNLTFREPGPDVALSAKAWRKADEYGPALVGSRVHAAFSPKIDTFRGVNTIEMALKDMRPATNMPLYTAGISPQDDPK